MRSRVDSRGGLNVDTVSPEDRSRIMRAVGRRNTTPELRVRKVAHRLGYRFRLHRKDLPGTPDLVFPKYGVCIFVHGCFWHRHTGCKKATTPKSNQRFWNEKFAANLERDRRKTRELKKLGWKVATIWECQTGDDALLAKILRKALSSST